MNAAAAGLAPGPAPRLATRTPAQRLALADDLAEPAIHSVRISGVLALVLFLTLAMLAGFVPIASGTLANGQISVDGERKTVQHSLGGIVSEINVKEGDVVKEGDIVLRLNSVQAGAAAGVVGSQVDSLRAEEAVRMAEATGLTFVSFPADLMARRTDLKVDAVITSEQAAFDARRGLARSQAEQLGQQLQQVEQSIASAQSESGAQRTQARLYEEELNSLRPLLEKGLTLKSRVLGLERSAEAARGQVASLDSNIKGLEVKANEMRTLQRRIDIDRRAEASEALRKLRADLAEALDRQLATDDTLHRTEVRAPISGVVMAVRINTVGGVVEPGQPILEVVPQSKRLIARVRIHPRDADDVRNGMHATVRLGAGSTRSPPHLEGLVQSVSADALSDQRTGESYFEVRIAIPPEAAASVPADLIAPGLPAEVLIKTGEHTMFDYLFSPIERAMFQTARDR